MYMRGIVMQIGTYADGRVISYDESSGWFDVGGTPVSVDAVVSYDAVGSVAWDRPDLRDWVLSLPRTKPTATPVIGPTAKKSKNGIAVTLAMILLALCACSWLIGSNKTPTPPTNSSSGASTGNGLVVTDHASTTGDYGLRYVTGTVVNQSKKNYGYAQVQINLYDDAGAQVGSTMANVNNLAAGGTWKFKAPILEDACKKYKIKDVTGF